MKKTLKYMAIALGLSATMFTSCEDKLDIANPNLTSSASYFKNADEVAGGLIAAYNMFNHNGMYKRHLYMAYNIPSDEMSPNTSFNDFNNWNYMSMPDTWDGCVFVWQAHFQQIAHINRVLSLVDAVEWENENDKNYTIGQAKFLRALAYYDLALLYNKVPLILAPQATMDDYYPASNSWLEVWEQVIKDFSEAAELLPKSYAEVDGMYKGQIGRATWGAATSYLAKSYMIRHRGENSEDISKAKSLLNKVISSGQYALVKDYYDNFSEENENNSESIFEVQFDETGTHVNWGGDERTANDDCDNWLSAYFVPTNWDDIYATKWVGDEFKDLTKDGKPDPRKYYSVWSKSDAWDGSQTHAGRELTNTCFADKKPSDFAFSMDYAIAKYTQVRDKSCLEPAGTSHGSHINMRLMRYAEVLMLYAECLIKEGNISQAAEYVNMVRERADLKTWEEAGINPQDEDEAMDQIAHERVCEFAFEGIRWIDIIRWGWLYDNQKKGQLSDHDSGATTDKNSSAAYGFNTYTAGYEFMPVPNVELEYNPNLVGNAANKQGYTSDYDE